MVGINQNDLENRILNLMIGSEYIELYDLQDNLSVHELMHIGVLKNEFTKIEIYDVDKKNQIFFKDKKNKIMCPYFKIKRKDDKK